MVRKHRPSLAVKCEMTLGVLNTDMGKIFTAGTLLNAHTLYPDAIHIKNYVDALWLNKDYICHVLLFEDTAF